MIDDDDDDSFIYVLSIYCIKSVFRLLRILKCSRPVGAVGASQLEGPGFESADSVGAILM